MTTHEPTTKSEGAPKKGVKEALHAALSFILTGFYYGLGFWLAAFVVINIKLLQ